MKVLSVINNDKDAVTKEYVDSKAGVTAVDPTSGPVETDFFIPTKTSELTNDSGFTGVYDATSIVAAAGSTITDAQYTGLANAINNNFQIIVSYLGNTAACGHVMDFGPNIVLSWIEYDKFYMLTVHSASGNVHNVTLDINNKQLAFADDIPEDLFVDGNFLVQAVGSTITNEQYEEIISNLQNGKIYTIYGAISTFDSKTKDNVSYLVAFLSFGEIERELWISRTNNNHTVTMEQIQLATEAALTTKQDILVSGTNIKTINNESLLGSGNINISGGGGTATDVQINGTSIISNNVANIVTETAYEASTNKIATMTDVSNAVASKLDGN